MLVHLSVADSLLLAVAMAPLVTFCGVAPLLMVIHRGATIVLLALVGEWELAFSAASISIACRIAHLLFAVAIAPFALLRGVAPFRMMVHSSATVIRLALVLERERALGASSIAITCGL